SVRAAQRLALYCLLALVSAACTYPGGGPSAPMDRGDAAQQAAQPKKKVLTMALATILDGFSIAASATLAGGGVSYAEMHSQALFTSDKTTGRPIPRLLSEHPTLDNGGLRLADDGKMVATYKLRSDAKWADGQPLTSRDLLFTYRVVQEPSMPIIDRGPANLMESAEAPDPRTFVVNWKQPYYLADALGLQSFWPLPAHILEKDYITQVEEQKDVQGFLARPYWTSEYFHVGPFKLVEFNQGVEATFDAVDTYFLGRPKVDRIVVKQFGDQGTVYANVLAGAVDLGVDNVLRLENAVELKARWARDGGGSIYFAIGSTWFIGFQFERSTPDHQTAVLDKRIRQGLYQAIDREAYSEAMSAGIPDRAAYALLSPADPLYPYVKDGWKQRYPYDLGRSAATFEEAGWRRGADDMLANARGERLRLDLRTPVDETAPIVADMWKKVGVESNIEVIPRTLIRDRQYRQAFRGAEITARGSEDVILTRLDCSASPTPQNRFSGNNRGHWCNAEFDRLAAAYRTGLREPDRGQAMRQIQEVVLDDLPIVLLNYPVASVFARKATTAFADDFSGGAEGGRAYGSFTRNAHEWDLVP
ncbi:MAG: hypothetical protein HW416_2879, partial [Chloroflexi bacterium]|nr:hypothetical protein [Chloroflexota bacterium]